MRTNQAAPGHCWEPADDPSSASGRIAGAAFSALPPLLPLIEISTQYYFNPHPVAPPPPRCALPCRLSPPMQAQRLSMRTSCLPEPFPLAAGPGWHWVGDGCLALPQPPELFLLPLSSLRGVGTPGAALGAIPPWSILGWGTGSPQVWDVPWPCYPQPSQHSPAGIRGC